MVLPAKCTLGLLAVPGQILMQVHKDDDGIGHKSSREAVLRALLDKIHVMIGEKLMVDWDGNYHTIKGQLPVGYLPGE